MQIHLVLESRLESAREGVEGVVNGETANESGVCLWDVEKVLAAGVSNLGPLGCMQLRMAVSEAQHKVVNLLKTL